MCKKLFKLAKIAGGVLVFSEVFGTLGEIQMLSAMHCKYADNVEETIDALKEISEGGDDFNLYQKTKAKFIAFAAETLIAANNK